MTVKKFQECVSSFVHLYLILSIGGHRVVFVVLFSVSRRSLYWKVWQSVATTKNWVVCSETQCRLLRQIFQNQFLLVSSSSNFQFCTPYAVVNLSLLLLCMYYVFLYCFQKILNSIQVGGLGAAARSTRERSHRGDVVHARALRCGDLVTARRPTACLFS